MKNKLRGVWRRVASRVRGLSHLPRVAIVIILAGLIAAAAILIFSSRLLEHWLAAFLAVLAAGGAVGITVDKARFYHGADRDAQAQHPLLSTIVGSLASILGLLFAATLVATQLAVEKFSGRVIVYRIGDPWLWATIAIFVGAIAVSLLGIGRSGASRKRIDFCVLLTGVALAYLVPFIVATLRSMETESFINFLLEKRDYAALEDLTRRAINEGLARDVETSMRGLRERTLSTLDSAKGDENKAREFTQLGLRIGMYAATKRDPEAVIVAMKYLTGMTTACTSRKYRGAADLFNESVVQLHRIGEEAFTQASKPNSTLAELSQGAADSFLDIAQVKAEDRELNLRRSLEAYQEALRYFRPETDRLRNAGIQNNLGTAYRILAGVRDRELNLGLAIAAFREALRVRTFDAFPQDYAMTQSNLGVAYAVLADLREKEPNLGLAIAAFHEALRVRTFDAFPQDYAKTQNNLGNAYVLLADVRDKEPNLGLAITAFHEALRVRTFGAFPQDYAMTQNNLGEGYYKLADVRDKEPNLGLAIAAFHEALRVRTFYAYPQQYAMTQTNLGTAHVLLADVRDKEGNLNLAIAAFQEALRVRTFGAFPHDYAETEYFLAIADDRLGEALLATRETETAKHALEAARSSCKNALRVFKPNYFPQRYEELTRLIKEIDQRLADLR